MSLSFLRKLVIYLNIIFLIFMFILCLFFQALAGRLGGYDFIDTLASFNIIDYSSDYGFSLWFFAGFFIPGFLYFIFLCYFWYRCYDNLRNLGITPEKGKHWGWACFVFPIWSLWMPIKIGNEIKDLNEISKKAWSIGLWWGVVILTITLNRIFSRIEDEVLMANIDIISMFFEVIALIMFIQISSCFVKSQEQTKDTLSLSL